VEKKGVIYFEDYCKLMLRKYREEDEQEFIRIMFKVNDFSVPVTRGRCWLVGGLIASFLVGGRTYRLL
jgi:hypothetical protein